VLVHLQDNFMISYNVKNKQAVRQLLDNLFAELPSREKDVLVRRNQLLSELAKKETLKEIGDEYNITRERVRQIENEGVKKLLKALKQEKELLNDIEQEVLTYLNRNGGIVLEQYLLDNFISQFDLKHYSQNAALCVLDNLVEALERQAENDQFHCHWIQKEVDNGHVKEVIDYLVCHLDEKEKPYPSKELMDLLTNHDMVQSKMDHYNQFLSDHDDIELTHLLENYLSLSKKVEKNILDKWGLSHWPEIKPKKLAEKIYLIFEHADKPLHFSGVADRINEAGFDKKSICAATVHNELIANKDYTLVGRGIYALKSWGYESGTVADVIEKILQGNGPMSKEEIYEQVLKQRMVNKSTIYLSLINKDKFVKAEGNKFALKA